MSDPVRAAVWAWLHEDGNEAMKDRAPLLGCVELWNEALAAGYRQGREEAEVHIRELLTAWQPGEESSPGYRSDGTSRSVDTASACN